MKNTNRIWTIVAILLMVLPFLAVGYELAAKESPLTIAVFAAMGLLLIGTLVAGLRVKATAPDDAQDAATPYQGKPASVKTQR
ncbi:MAG: hypothetical protein HXY39_17480 [Chloroflexi bacterium]|nr:hypothetical protein [Chloroflexota bacterium]